MLVKMHHAKTHLSDLVERALRGEEVVIARGEIPAVRLVPVARPGHPVLGALRDVLPPMSPERFEWSEAELKEAGLDVFGTGPEQGS